MLMSASDILACVYLTTVVLEMFHWALVLHVCLSCVDIHIIADGKMLANAVSVEVASDSVSKCICQRRCRTC